MDEMADRLDSWKAIASYLGREVRTAQRWAASRGLPVHRLPGGSRPRVFSSRTEIDAWLGARSLTASRVARSNHDPSAHDLWLQGRSSSQIFTVETFAYARGCYEEAIARAPEFAPPHFGLAELLFRGAQFGLVPMSEVLSRAREALGRSLELDPGSGDAHALLGVFRGVLDYDWSGSESAFRRALDLSPGSARILSDHSWFHLVPTMQLDQALEEAEQAAALDPLSPFARGRLGLVRAAARRYAPAVEECRAAVDLAPGIWWLRWFYATALFLAGSTAEAFRQAQKAHSQVPDPIVVGGLALLHGLCGRTRKARRLVVELQDLSRTSGVSPLAFALAYTGMGDPLAFEWFERAIDEHDPVVTHLASMPLYDGLRGDPRFGKLLQRMHLG